jgi:hypothetical protein
MQLAMVAPVPLIKGTNMRVAFRALLASAAIGAASLLPGAAQAQGTITDSTSSFSVGIAVNGELFDPRTMVGFQRLSDGFDALRPSENDSWGVETSLGSAYADH